MILLSRRFSRNPQPISNRAIFGRSRYSGISGNHSFHTGAVCQHCVRWRPSPQRTGRRAERVASTGAAPPSHYQAITRHKRNTPLPGFPHRAGALPEPGPSGIHFGIV